MVAVQPAVTSAQPAQAGRASIGVAASCAQCKQPARAAPAGTAAVKHAAQPPPPMPAALRGCLLVRCTHAKQLACSPAPLAPAAHARHSSRINGAAAHCVHAENTAAFAAPFAQASHGVWSFGPATQPSVPSGWFGAQKRRGNVPRQPKQRVGAALCAQALHAPANTSPRAATQARQADTSGGPGPHMRAPVTQRAHRRAPRTHSEHLRHMRSSALQRRVRAHRQASGAAGWGLGNHCIGSEAGGGGWGVLRQGWGWVERGGEGRGAAEMRSQSE